MSTYKTVLNEKMKKKYFLVTVPNWGSTSGRETEEIELTEDEYYEWIAENPRNYREGGFNTDGTDNIEEHIDVYVLVE